MTVPPTVPLDLTVWEIEDCSTRKIKLTLTHKQCNSIIFYIQHEIKDKKRVLALWKTNDERVGYTGSTDGYVDSEMHTKYLENMLDYITDQQYQQNLTHLYEEILEGDIK